MGSCSMREERDDDAGGARRDPGRLRVVGPQAARGGAGSTMATNEVGLGAGGIGDWMRRELSLVGETKDKAIEGPGVVWEHAVKEKVGK